MLNREFGCKPLVKHCDLLKLDHWEGEEREELHYVSQESQCLTKGLGVSITNLFETRPPWERRK